MAIKIGLAKILELPEWQCHLLASRGVVDKINADAYLHGRMSATHDPWALSGIETATGRILSAIRNQETIIIYGDYDVDGVTSTALLLTVFKALGGRADYYIPDRITEGYGLNIDALKIIHQQGASLVITVDNGVAAVEQAAAAKKMGLDLIITDHHLPGSSLPDCLALVTPKTSPDYPYDMLAGVGVAYKIAQCLVEKSNHPTGPELLDSLIELVAVGTVCDVAPLNGENRILVKEGIRRLRKGRWAGFNALCRVAGVEISRIDSGTLGFVIGPRLNAGGRIGNARMGVELLMSKDPSVCRELATRLDEENKIRRKIEKEVTEQAKSQAADRMASGDKILIVDGQGWHPGVIGLAASRIQEAFHRPAMVIGIDGDKGKGSGRSRRPFHLVEALDACSDLLVQYGGHAFAAGITIQASKISEFRKRINEVAARNLTDDDLLPRLSIDLEVGLADLNAEVMKNVSQMSPFGMKNPKPVFIARDCRLLQGTRPVGSGGEHLKLKVGQNGSVKNGIAFRMGEDLNNLNMREPVDLAFQLDWNEYMGTRELQLVVQDIRQPCGQAIEEATP